MDNGLKQTDRNLWCLESKLKLEPDIWYSIRPEQNQHCYSRFSRSSTIVKAKYILQADTFYSINTVGQDWKELRRIVKTKYIWPTDFLYSSRLGKPSFKKSAVFLNIVQTGGGGVNPWSKIMPEIVVCSGGHLTTWNLHEKGLLRHWWWNLGVK